MKLQLPAPKAIAQKIYNDATERSLHNSQTQKESVSNIFRELSAMASVEKAVALLLIVMMAALKFSDGAVYKVGDSAGWTTLGNIDYKKWAASKNFQVGDTISEFPFLLLQILLCFSLTLSLLGFFNYCDNCL